MESWLWGMMGVTCGSTPRTWIPAPERRKEGSGMTGVTCDTTPCSWAPAFAGATVWRVPVCAEVPDRGWG